DRLCPAAGGPDIEPAAGLTAAFPALLIKLARERVAKLADRLRDGCFRRLLDERHAVVPHLDHHTVVVRNLPKDLAPDGFLGLLQTDLARLVANAVDHDLHLLIELRFAFE